MKVYQRRTIESGEKEQELGKLGFYLILPVVVEKQIYFILEREVDMGILTITKAKIKDPMLDFNFNNKTSFVIPNEGEVLSSFISDRLATAVYEPPRIDTQPSPRYLYMWQKVGIAWADCNKKDLHESDQEIIDIWSLAIPEADRP